MDKLSLVITLLLLGSSPAMAASDTGLYAPAPPEGSAFVRFVSDLNYSGSEPVLVNGKKYDYLDYKEVSSYFTLPSGNVSAVIGKAKSSFNIEAGKFYTVVLEERGTLALRQDPVNNNRAKAQIILYNFSGEDNLSLRTADGNVEVIPPLAAGQMAQRQINPVRVELALFKGEQKIKDIGSPSLERAQSYSAFAVSNDDVSWVQATTNTTR